jgi:sirohydrochlorin cobaltochelatase
MTTSILLAMHGATPNDFPEEERVAYFRLRAQLKLSALPDRTAVQTEHDRLDTKIRAWPRTAQNDPFYVGSQALAEALKEASGCPVIVGFNEFCAPDLDQALDQAAALPYHAIIVVTPMMTVGGGHAEGDLPEAIQRAQKRHPDRQIRYAWPFPTAAIARFLAEQIRPFISPR